MRNKDSKKTARRIDMKTNKRILSAVVALFAAAGAMTAAALPESSGNAACEKVKHDAYVSDAKILYGSKYAEVADKIEFTRPIYVIDGNTYVPLRESAELLDMKVDWNSETRTIALLPEDYDSESVFEEASRLLEIELPQGEIVPEYVQSWSDFARDSFIMKYKIEKDDYLKLCESLEKKEDYEKYDKNHDPNDKIYTEWWKDECDVWHEYWYDIYRWWNIRAAKDCEAAFINFFRPTKNGYTHNADAFVGITIEDGEYYLYAYYAG